MQDNASLLTPENRGGVIAQQGFQFQDAFIVSYLPQWLSDPEFSALLKEGSGDVEISFDGSVGKRIDIIQVKDHRVTKSEFVEVLQSFHKKDSNAPGTFRSFVFACRGFGSKEQSFRRSLEDIRGVTSMYGENDRPIEDTKKDIQAKQKELGLEDIPTDFLIEKVKFDTNLGDMRTDQILADQFVGGVERCLPNYINNPGLRSVYKALQNKIVTSIRKTIQRKEIEKIIEETIKMFPDRAQKEGITLRLYHWEDTPFDLSNPWDILLDWSAYFDREKRRVPDTEFWQSNLISALQQEQKKIRSGTSLRLIRFFPSACLSAGFAVGWTFSEVKGYTLIVPQRSEIWRTDCSPATSKNLNLTIQEGDSLSKELVVKLSIVADVDPKVSGFLNRQDQKFRAKVSFAPDVGNISNIDGATALSYAYQIKQEIRKLVDKFGCEKIHLFYAGPLALAVFIGWQFNAMHALVQCYEEQIEGFYIPSCLLDAR